MSDGNSGVSDPRPRRWVWVVLIISLALNLLFVGVTAGAFLMRGPWGPPRERMMAAAMNEVVQTMPDERRDGAQQLLRRARTEIRSLRRELRSARRATVMAFRSDPFDEAAFQQAASKLETAEMNLRKAKTALGLELGQYLTAEERRQFLRTVMQKRWAGRWKRGHDRKPPGPGGAEQDRPVSDGQADDTPGAGEPDQERSDPSTP